jgi:ABC-2 type transport system permease protein
VVKHLRLLAVGGYISYRALFSWLNPFMYTFALLIPAVTQLAFFVFLGRTFDVANDRFYVVGNSLVACATPALFGMAAAIEGERFAQTLPLLIASPANRVVVFAGRALPATANGIVISIWTFAVATLVFRIPLPSASLAPLAVAIAVTSFACVGLGLCNAALGLRWRETAVLGNLLLLALLMFAGVNVPLHLLPRWIAHYVSVALPVTHGAAASRAIVAGSTLSQQAHRLILEGLIGLAYLAAGLCALVLFEREARRSATLEIS